MKSSSERRALTLSCWSPATCKLTTHVLQRCHRDGIHYRSLVTTLTSSSVCPPNFSSRLVLKYCLSSGASELNMSSSTTFATAMYSASSALNKSWLSVCLLAMCRICWDQEPCNAGHQISPGRDLLNVSVACNIPLKTIAQFCILPVQHKPDSRPHHQLGRRLCQGILSPGTGQCPSSHAGACHVCPALGPVQYGVVSSDPGWSLNASA